MSEKVVGLRGEFVAPGELSEYAAETVSVLEKALAAARSGRYEAIGIVMVAKIGDPDADTYRAWSTGGTAPPTRLLPGLSMLAVDISQGG